MVIAVHGGEPTAWPVIGCVMKLSDRLSCVAQHVLPGLPMADIGTDHGQLPVWLVRTGMVPSAIAMDLRPSPLSVARRQVAMAGVGDRVECRLSDGLEKLTEREVATVTICGMGGGLMARILGAHPEVRESVARLVLQPNNDVEKLRRVLQALSWGICAEELLIEGRYVYPTIVAEKVVVSRCYDESELAFGPLLRVARSEAFVEMLEREARQVRRVLGQCQGSPEATRRFEARLALVEQELGRG